MKSHLTLIVLFVILAVGCAYGSSPGSFPPQPSAPGIAPLSQSVLLAANAGEAPVGTPAKPVDVINDDYKDDEKLDYADDKFKEEKVEIADPIEPFNRVMYQFNDKLYFWALKPVARGYKAVVPEPARISVKNFFSNLAFPARFLNCLLQTDFSGAATEFGRFTVNTVWGVGGLLDPSAGKELDLQKQDTDLGQTLGVYGVGHGFYIMWPIYGPSSPRDSVTIIGDQILYPPSYIYPWYASLGVWSFEKVNYTSLRIGDYESLIGAAIDPYVSIRDAYIQYRLKDVKARQVKSMLFKAKADETGKPASNESLPKK